MPLTHRLSLGVSLGALLCGLLPSVEAQAAQSCAEMVQRTKQRTGTVQVPMPHMSVAAKYVAAAEEALKAGDEAKCLEELSKTESWIRMNANRRGSR